MNVYPFVEAEQVEGNVTKAYALMEVSRSAYYQWHQHRPSPRQVADAELGARIQAIFDGAQGTYGGRECTGRCAGRGSARRGSGWRGSCASWA